MNFQDAYKGVWVGLSKNDRARDRLMSLPAARHVKERFIAGDTTEDGIEVVKRFNNLTDDGMPVLSYEGNPVHISGVMDFVGESVKNIRGTLHACDTYCHILREIDRNDLNSRIAVKPSQLGMNINPTLCRNNIGFIADIARPYGIGIEIDAEEDEKAKDTLEIFSDLRRQNYNVTVALQSARLGSCEDAKALAEMGATTRLVKSAYKEGPDVAHTSKFDVDHNYMVLMEILAEGINYNGGRLILGTHDDKMIEYMKEMIENGNLDKDSAEVDMLLGVRNKRLVELARQGYRTGVYVPFGRDWWAYTCRRIGERPENMLFVARSLFSR